MSILIGCTDGLYESGAALRRIDCPLRTISALACAAGQLAVIDETEHLLWNGRSAMAVDPGVETALCWRGHVLTLSSETDSITLIDAAHGLPVTLAPAGVCPQDMCLTAQPDTVAVCGGADGMVRLLALPSLVTLAQYRVPGSAARIACQRGALYVLCTVEDGDLCSLLCRILPRNTRFDPLLTLPGLPGAIAGDGKNGVWFAAGESLYHMTQQNAHDVSIGGFGLISTLAPTPRGLLVCDPVLDTCLLLDHGVRQVLRDGCVECAGVW